MFPRNLAKKHWNRNKTVMVVKSIPLANRAVYAIMGVVWLRKELSSMGTLLVALVFGAFLFFILTAGYNEDKTWNL